MKQHVTAYYQQLKKTNILSNFFNLGGIQLSNILLLLLTIRIISGVVGVAVFGVIMFANRFAQFAGTIVNYGTNQSAVRDIAFNLSDSSKLRLMFYSTLWLRGVLFVLYLLVILGMNWFNIGYYKYLLFALPLVLAEAFNPLCFCIGFEKLRLFNICNLVVNCISLCAVGLFIKTIGDAVWVNFILGLGNSITYIALLFYLKKRYSLRLQRPNLVVLKGLLRDNFYLTINNVSVNLQQSIILFALAGWSTPIILGAYSICDRIIGQCRNLLITISNAVYPNAARIYKESPANWNAYRRKTKYMLAGLFMAGALFLILAADPFIYLLSKEHNETAILFLRVMALVPVVSALNVLNVLDQLLKNHNVYIFRIAAILFPITMAIVFAVLAINKLALTGAFTLIIEVCALMMYELVITKPAYKNA